MAHDPKGQKQLGRLLSQANTVEGVIKEYAALYLETVFTGTSLGKHFNVIEHQYGHLDENISDDQKSLLYSRLQAY